MGAAKITVEEINGNLCEVSCVIEDIGEYGKAGTKLCLQKCMYHYDSGIMEQGYRFIRRSPDGKCHLYQGQTCIPTTAMARKLLDLMEERTEEPERRYSRESGVQD